MIQSTDIVSKLCQRSHTSISDLNLFHWRAIREGKLGDEGSGGQGRAAEGRVGEGRGWEGKGWEEGLPLRPPPPPQKKTLLLWIRL